MSTVFLLILLVFLAIGIGLAYVAYRSMRDEETPSEPPDPPGTRREPPKYTAQEKAERQK